jgi:hypothetical protein
MKSKILKAIKIVLIAIGFLYLFSPLLIVGAIEGYIYSLPSKYGPRTRKEFCHALPDKELETLCLTRGDYDYYQLLTYAFPLRKTTREQVSDALGKYYMDSYTISNSSVYPDGSVRDTYGIRRELIFSDTVSFTFNEQGILLDIYYEDW